MKFISIFLFSIIITPSAFAGRTCVDLLDNNPPLKLLIKNKNKNPLPALISRFKPVHKTADFDIRIVSNSFIKNDFSPELLKQESIKKITTLLDRLKNTGLKAPTYLHFLIESKLKSIKFNKKDLQSSKRGAKSNGKWVSQKSNSPFHIYSDYKAGLPKLFNYSAFPADDKVTSQIIGITALSKDYHFLVNDFAIAHEIAHSTEPYASHNSLIWKEARADIIAYLITGESKLTLKKPLFLTVFDERGRESIKETILKRSLSDPKLSSMENIIPNPYAFHENSEIISSTLYRVSKIIGKKKIFNFISWMDALQQKDLIAMTMFRTNLKDKISLLNEITYVNEDNLFEVSNAVTNEVEAILLLFMEWVENSSKLSSDKIFFIYQEVGRLHSLQ